MPSWYPDKDEPLRGIFCQKQAQAISRYAQLTVMVIRPCDLLQKRRLVVESDESGIQVIRIYFRKSKSAGLGKYIDLAKACVLGMNHFNVLRRSKGNFDVLHVNEINPMGLVAIVLKSIYRIPYVITLHGSEYTKEDGRYFNKSVLQRWLVKKILDRSSFVVAVSNYLQAALATICRHANLVVIANLVECHPEQAGGRSWHGMNLLHVSLLCDRKKNVSGLIRIMAALKNDPHHARLDIVGCGQDEEKLKQLSRDLGLFGHIVFFHGLVAHDQVGDFFDRADIFICNSKVETFSVACAEALMHGVPVLSTRCGGPEEYITGEVGFLVPLNDPEALLAALKTMMAHLHEYDRTAIRNYAESLFAPKKIALEYMELYKKAAGGSPD